MDAGYHFYYLIRFALCLFFGAAIGTLFIDIDHFFPQVLKNERVGYGTDPDDCWLHSLYWPTIIIGIGLGMLLHLVLDYLNHGHLLTHLI